MKNLLSNVARASLLSAAILTTPFSTHAASIDDALSAQPEEAQARYGARHPKETLEFFGIKEGMTVVEALPGGGWYSKILLPALGKEGKLIGADYPISLYSNFGFMTPERLEGKKTWVTTWTEEANGWRGDNDASVAAFQFVSLPEDMQGTADAVLFIRALHNFARFESVGGYLSKALDESFAVLKEGGTVGVVQHEAREDRPDDWANGSNGYLKKQFIIDKFTKHGFEFVGESSINENPKDQADEGDIVWRLPPSFSGSGDDEKKRTAMQEIGESNRTTLKFQKPVTSPASE